MCIPLDVPSFWERNRSAARRGDRRSYSFLPSLLSSASYERSVGTCSRNVADIAAHGRCHTNQRGNQTGADRSAHLDRWLVASRMNRRGKRSQSSPSLEYTQPLLHHPVKVVARAPNHRREVVVVLGHEVGLVSAETQGRARPMCEHADRAEKRALAPRPGLISSSG